MNPDEFNMEVSIPADEDGYLDRECPHDACMAAFKVHLDDWTEKVRDEEVFCPVCGHTAESDQWLSQEQVKHCEDRLMAEIMPIIDGEMMRMTRDFNRSMPRGGMISMSMTYKPSRPVAIVPLSAAELMRQRYACECCGCRYAAIGAAFFCPSCAHNSAATAFSETIAVVRECPAIRKALEGSLDRDAAANAYRLILEENLCKLISSFQRFAEAMFEALPNASRFNPRRNLFQNLKESSNFWGQAIGKRYEAMVGVQEWNELQRYFQKRHLLSHKDGLVDDEYVQKTGDHQYRSGQRLVLKERDVLHLSQLIESLATALQSTCDSASAAAEEM